MSKLTSSFVGTYDPNEIDVLINGDEAFGFAEGAMVTVEKNEPLFNTHVGAKGETTRVVVRDNNYTITIRLQSNSPFVDVLEKYKTVDNVFKVPPVLSFQIRDPSSYEGFFSATAWLLEDPSREWSNDQGVREYTFFAVGGVTSDDAVNTGLNIAANLGLI